MAARFIPLQEHCECRLNRIVSVTIDLKALTYVTALARLKFLDEGRPAVMFGVDEGRPDAIRKKDFWLLDPVRSAGEAEDLKGWIIRRNQIQSRI
jgi:hypothetical protein